MKKVPISQRKKKFCEWCHLPRSLPWHAQCIPKPDYHHWAAYSAWMSHPERPGRDGWKTRRILTPEQEEELETWRIIKGDDIRNDELT